MQGLGFKSCCQGLKIAKKYNPQTKTPKRPSGADRTHDLMATTLYDYNAIMLILLLIVVISISVASTACDCHYCRYDQCLFFGTVSITVMVIATTLSIAITIAIRYCYYYISIVIVLIIFVVNTVYRYSCYIRSRRFKGLSGARGFPKP